MPVEIPSLESPIEVRIAWARDCHARMGEALLRDENIARLLDDLQSALQDSRREMTRTGIPQACRDCEEREGGSCCGAGIENRYSITLLLINLLLGATLPRERRDVQSCFFLGEKGCCLPARHVLCINFLCKKITECIDPRKLAPLREREGVELTRLFRLHERIKEFLGI
ncbi:MAG: hypothetical protein JW821_10805 [Deltaproteobacteria bacterium]|nr:hypothetical protein [Deltaproteobacteria bacterium]